MLLRCFSTAIIHVCFWVNGNMIHDIGVLIAISGHCKQNSSN